MFVAFERRSLPLFLRAMCVVEYHAYELLEMVLKKQEYF